MERGWLVFYERTQKPITLVLRFGGRGRRRKTSSTSKAGLNNGLLELDEAMSTRKFEPVWHYWLTAHNDHRVKLQVFYFTPNFLLLGRFQGLEAVASGFKLVLVRCQACFR